MPSRTWAKRKLHPHSRVPTCVPTVTAGDRAVGERAPDAMDVEPEAVARGPRRGQEATATVLQLGYRAGAIASMRYVAGRNKFG
jgi:hypothetical protein